MWVKPVSPVTSQSDYILTPLAILYFYILTSHKLKTCNVLFAVTVIHHLKITADAFRCVGSFAVATLTVQPTQEQSNSTERGTFDVHVLYRRTRILGTHTLNCNTVQQESRVINTTFVNRIVLEMLIYLPDILTGSSIHLHM